MLLMDGRDSREASPLLPLILALCASYSFVLLFSAVLSAIGWMPLSLGAILLGSGFEVMGPAPYFLFGVGFALSAWGLHRRRNWGRHLAIALCAIGAFLLVPTISSAVVDERWLWMSVLWIDLLPRVVIATVLWRESAAFH